MADESDDDFVTYGTSLEPIDDEAARRKPISLEDQVVTDKQGRRRFHGAFTGGFSAGYFNTVGTKEGWRPSTFVSSRGQRTGGQRKQTAEDFMDEEDLGHFGIAPRKIVTTDKFAGEDKPQKRPATVDRPSVIPGEPPLQDLIVPNNESMGARLLRKMGWRHGQGVGSKVRRGKKKSMRSEGDPRASHSGNVDDEDDDDDDSNFYKGFLFAPTDVEEIAMAPKDDYHGIGYRGLDPTMAGMGRHVSLFKDQPVYSRSGRRGIAGQAFGVGAFETADDDIYGVDSMSNYDRVLGGEDPGGDNFGWTAPKEGHKGSTGVLENFKTSVHRRPPNKMFPPPALPRDFRPFHTFDKSSKENRPPTTAASNFKSSRFTLSSTQRGAMLGEEQLPGPSSVFDFLSADDRQKLKNSASQDQPSSHPEEKQVSKPSLRQFHQAPTSVPAAPTASDPQRLQRARGGYQPFANDAAKQRRYEEYLARKRGGKVAESDVATPSDNLTEWERQREMEEFVRASSLYQPLSGLMASRFVSAKNRDDETVDVPAEEGGDKTEQTKAAEMKMFGKLTRDVLEWHPDSLLCKRFNVPNPYPGSTIVGLPTVKKDKFTIFNFLSMAPPAEEQAASLVSTSVVSIHPGSQGAGAGAGQQQTDKTSRWDKRPALLANVGVSDRENGSTDSRETGDDGGRVSSIKTPAGQQPVEEAESEKRPPMDLFKAIFASSSDDDDDGEEDEEEETEEKKVNKEGMEKAIGQEAPSQDDTRCNTVSTFAGTSSADHPQSIAVSASGNSTQEACTADRNVCGVLTPSLNSASDSDEVYGPSLPPPSSAPIHQDKQVRGHSYQQDKSMGSQRDRSGDRIRFKGHRKEKRRKKHDSRSSSRHKRSSDKKKAKKRKKAKKKESGTRHRGHHRSTSRLSHHSYRQAASDCNYDASGSSSSSSSSSSSDDSS